MSRHIRPSAVQRMRLLSLAVTVVVLVAVAAGCGDNDEQASTTTEAQAADSAEHDGPINPCTPDAPEDARALEGEKASPEATIIEVSAVDHEFQGLEASYPQGDYGFRMTNTGREVHEMAVIRIKDGEARSVEELLELTEEESDQVTEYIGGTVACPGETADALGVQMTPGRYALLCFIPTGLTPDVPSSEEAFEELGPPHFTRGMAKEIQITGS